MKCPFLGNIHALCLSKTESETVLGSSFFLFIVIQRSRGARINKSILMIADCFRAKNDKNTCQKRRDYYIYPRDKSFRFNLTGASVV